MRLHRTLAPAAALLFVAAVSAQTTPPAGGTGPGPTTGWTTPAPKAPGAGGTTPAPKSPTVGGTVPGSGAKLTFPTDPGRTGAGTGTANLTFPTQLFRTPDVSRSLNLTDAQLSQLNTLSDQLQARYRQQYEALARLSAQERAARLRDLNRQFLADWLSAADDVFTEQQLARYQQLQLQFAGFEAFTDPAVRRQLSFTDAQQARLAEALAWREQQMMDIMRQAELDRARALQMFNDFNRASQDRLGQLLTAEQMRLWAQMTGDPFQFPPPFAMTPGAATTLPGAGTPPAGAGTPGPTTGGTRPAGGPTTGGPVPPKR